VHIDRRIIYSAAACSIAFSYIIHYPLFSSPIYSDIVSFWYRGFWKPEIPYLELPFEYPPLAGFLTYLSAVLGRDLVAYYTIFSLIIAGFYFLLVEITVRLCKMRRVDLGYVLVFLILSPSILLYTIYNFDVIFAALLILSIYLLMKGRVKLSAIIFSVTSLVKLVNILAIPFILEYLEDWKDRIAYLLLSIGVFGAVNIALWYANPSFIDETYFYHLRWGLENAWFLVFFPDEKTWNTAKLFSLALLCYGLLKVYARECADLPTRMFMILSVFLLSSYVFTPQMVLWLLPLLAVMGRLPIPYFVFELANSAIILLWFEEPNPLQLGALPQYFAILRAVMLFIILVEVYRGVERFKPIKVYEEYF